MSHNLNHVAQEYCGHCKTFTMTNEQLKDAITEAGKPFDVTLDSGERLVVRSPDHILFAPDGTVIIYPETGGRYTVRPTHIASVKDNVL